MKKNVAGQFVGGQMNSKTDGSAVTTGTTTVYVTGDAGTQAVGSVGSGACAHEGRGFWTYAPAQAETNYDHVAFTFEHTSGVNATVQLYPSFPQTGDNFARLGAPAGASVSADIAAVKVDTAAVKTKTDFLPSATAGAAGGVFIAGTNAATTITTGLTTTFTGNLTGSVGSVTGAVGSVTGAVGSVTGAVGSVTGAVGSVTGNVGGNVVGSVASVTARVTADTDQLAGQTVTAGAGVTFPTSVASPTNITAGTITTVTNLTNAPTAGDLTATMKTSVTTAATAATPVAASVTGAVGSVTGNVGGNVVGSVASVTADVGITQTGADKAWGTTTRLLTAGTNIVLAKGVGVTGFNDLSAAQVNTEADTALADVGVTTTITGRVDVAVSTRLATAGYTAPDNTSIATILGVTNKIDPMLEDDGDSPSGGYRYTAEALELAPTGGSAPTASQNAAAVWDEARAGHVAAGSFGQGVASVQGSVTGSTASVTGNVGGNVVGSVASVTADVGITQAGADKAWSTATRLLTAGTNIVLAKGVGVTGFNDLSAAQVNAEADTALADVGVTTTVTGRIDIAVSTRASQTSVDTLDNFVDTEVSDIKVVTDKLSGMIELGVGSPTYYRYNTPALELAPTGGSAPTASVIADAVWDELLAGHAVGGSAGAALSAAGTAGDPWSTALPGAYGAGTAGKIVGDNINATISSRATQASVDTIDGIVDNILIDTAEIGAAGAGLTALGDARIANLDATISSRTKPADTQAAVTTVTNLTNAPTAGDFTAVMKTSLNASTPASITGAVGSVTGGVTVTTNNDKTGYRLSATGVDDVWDEAIAGHLTAGTTGKALNDATAAGNPWSSVLEGTLTAGDLLRIQAGVAVGKTTILSTGSGTANVQFRDASDLSLIVEADMTGSERTAVALTP